MALLKQPAYRDTRAEKLTTGTDHGFTAEQIQNYFATPGITGERAMNDALKYGVTLDDISAAMQDKDPRFSTSGLQDYTKTRGVSYDRMGEGELRVPGTYKQTRAGILAGPGNESFTNQEIVALAKSGNRPEHIMNEVIARGGSLEQVSNAMQGSGTPGDWSIENLKRYTEGRGVDYGRVDDAPYSPTVTPTMQRTAQARAERAPFVRADFDEELGTVAGRLRQTLDPNNPLMQRAQSLAQQQAAKRGMLNSGMAASQGMAAMTDAGLQIATPDANAFNQFALTNAQAENQANQFNVGEVNKMGMFNAGSLNDMAKTQMGIDTQLTLADRATGDLKLRLNNEREIKNMDTESQMAIQNAKLEAEASANYGSLAQTYMNEKYKIDSNPEFDADTKARLHAEYERIMNKAASVNRFMEAAPLDLDFSVPPSPEAAPDEGPTGGTVTTPEAATPQVQSQAEVLAKKAEVRPGRYDTSANLINRNGTRLASVDIAQLNHANQLTGQTVSPERVVTAQELIDKSKEPGMNAWYKYKDWRDSLDVMYDPSMTSGGPMLYLWPE